jgi:threonine/homoserine/homoserine lactone efflux protein
MLAWDVAVQFVLVAVVLALAPGPDNVFVLMQSALFGVGKGLAVTLGLCTGLIVHTSAVALGVAALVQASATAFVVLKIIGAGYLLYLAYGAFKASGGSPSADDDTPVAAKSAFAYYARGVLMNITQIAQLGLLFMVTTLVVFGAIAIAAGSLSGWLRRSPRAVPVMNKITGCVFVGLALKLATAQRH